MPASRAIQQASPARMVAERRVERSVVLATLSLHLGRHGSNPQLEGPLAEREQKDAAAGSATDTDVEKNLSMQKRAYTISMSE